MRLYVSTPMKGKSEEEIRDTMNHALNIVKGMTDNEVELIDTIVPKAEHEYLDVEPALFCLGKAIQLLATADVVIFMRGWDTARGCKIEHECATVYGIPMTYQSVNIIK